MWNSRVRKGVVIAAGQGTRMQPVTGAWPKVLFEYEGMPLISYPVQALAAAGIEEIAVVVGYRKELVQADLGDGGHLGITLTYVDNPYYQWSENALSVLTAGRWTQQEPFVLCMGDHVMDPSMVERLLAIPREHDTVCVDRHPAFCADLEEATRVRLDKHGHILRIGKGLRRWDAVDTGVFLMTRRFTDAARQFIAVHGMRTGISHVVQHMVDSGQCFDTCDVTGLFWADMDSQADIDHATLKAADDATV